MGGRGASSGVSKLNKKGDRGGNNYGTMYQTVLDADGEPLIDGNIKFVEKTPRNKEKNEETLMETMTRGRVYVVVDQGRPESIVYFDNNNKRRKQIDLDDRHGPGAHVHHGYHHDEYSPSGRPTGLLPKEREMIERVLRIWDNRTRKP